MGNTEAEPTPDGGGFVLYPSAVAALVAETPREQDEHELDALARGLVLPVDALIGAMIAEWPDPAQMPVRLQEPSEALMDAFEAILNHPAFQRLQQEEQA